MDNKQFKKEEKIQELYFSTGTHSCYSFCPKCGVDITQFSHENNCPKAKHA